jgi:hypothetical protein
MNKSMLRAAMPFTIFLVVLHLLCNYDLIGTVRDGEDITPILFRLVVGFIAIPIIVLLFVGAGFAFAKPINDTFNKANGKHPPD